MKVVDIVKTDVPDTVRNYLLSYFITYRDEVLEEHLININDAEEEINNSENPRTHIRTATDREVIILNVREMARLCADEDAGYVRFVDQ